MARSCVLPSVRASRRCPIPRWALVVAWVAVGWAVLVPPVSVGALPSTPQTTAAAQGWAHQLVGQVYLPPGSQPTTAAGTVISHFYPEAIALPGPAQASASAFFADPLPPDATAAAIEGHYPHRAMATTNGPPPAGVSAVALVPPVSGPNHEAAEVTYSIVANGTGSQFRVQATVVWAPDRSPAETVAATGPVLVTGYTSGSLMQGATGPVEVRVTGPAASRIRRAFNALYRAASTPGCMESIAEFRLVFPKEGTSKVFTASASGCGNGVSVTAGSQQLDPLRGSCQLLGDVAAVLPPRKGAQTKSRAKTCWTLFASGIRPSTR